MTVGCYGRYGMYNTLLQPVTKFFKLQLHTQDALKRLGIETARDLLFHRPTGYITNKICTSNSEFKHGEQIIIEVKVSDIEVGKKGRPTKVYTETASGPLVLIFFNKIPVFLFNKLRPGYKHIIEGKVEFNQGFYFQITHPQFILDKKQVCAIEPVYPLTYGVTSKQIHGYVLRVFDEVVCKDEIATILADFVMTNDSIIQLLKNIHMPTSANESDLANNIKCLAKYELLANQIHLADIRNQCHKSRGRSFCGVNNNKQNVLANLGFTLTQGQEEVLAEISMDQAASYRMVRMLQGDVGSGKTLVALLSMLNVAARGVQSVLMAPTDLLANQHFEFFKKALANLNLEVALLTGKIKTNERRETLAKLESGKIQILIGTHAVFQEKVNFKDLGYIIIDEQHRFGVEQRTDLINKATMPDLLVMTATPIPRSLTLTLFGDMSCSRLLSKPKGRLPIMTSVISRARIDDVVASIERKLKKGEKVYWICPLIEKTDEEEDDNKLDDDKLTDITTRFAMLQNLYQSQVGFVHGKMKNDAKDSAMQDFKDGKTRILVATTVIEVGIDVPDATLIIIENAEKFGLAQLHQLRGRVGRSDLQSHAILMYEPTRSSAVARSRMAIMKESHDGFYIAEQDLLLRGGGEILGLKQSGQQEFVFADLTMDMSLLTKCNEYASKISEGNYSNFKGLVSLFARREKAEVLE